MAMTKAKPMDQTKLKDGICTALDCVVKICSAASIINPIFGTVGSVAKMLLGILDDREERKAIHELKKEFDCLNHALDQLSEQSHAVLQDIKKEAVEAQFNKVVENLHAQFRSFREVTEAQPEHFETKKNNFIKSYRRHKSDQNLHTLYDGVMGNPKAFSEPILKVYMEHSGGKREVMERLCTHIHYLFLTGLLSFMTYATIRGLAVEMEKKEWSEKLQAVEEKIQETLSSCT